MKILITGWRGFIGKNLTEALKNILYGRDKRELGFSVSKLFLISRESSDCEFEEACRDADFVFNLAGANSLHSDEEFMETNCNFVSHLITTLEKYKNFCPVVQASSIQATLEGRYCNGYGKSKRAAESVFFEYSERTGATVYIYRFPNVFGKWCRPNYNSAVATFCHNIANDLPISINDRKASLELLYIDDLVNSMLSTITGKVERCEYDGTRAILCSDGSFCTVSNTYFVTLEKISELLNGFKKTQNECFIPEMPENSFEKKLYATFLSYLPKERVTYVPQMNSDRRGSFTELMKTDKCGQVSVNITKPGEVKGGHWHNSKCERFTVISGKGLILMKNIDTGEEMRFEVSGERFETVQILPGYVHSIANISDSEDLVTLMWANESFDIENPDTYTR